MPLAILAVGESEPDHAVHHLLSDEGYAVVEVLDERSFHRAVASLEADLVVVDLDQVDLDDAGLSLVIEEAGPAVACVLLVGADLIGQPRDGSRRGGEALLRADDFVVKPVRLQELALRIRGARQLHRSTVTPSRLEFDGLVIEPATRTVVVRGIPVGLTQLELALLRCLASTPGRPYSREELLERAWGPGAGGQDPGTVTEHIRRVRAKIEVDPHRPCWIRTVRNAGYVFDRRQRLASADEHEELAESTASLAG